MPHQFSWYHLCCFAILFKGQRNAIRDKATLEVIAERLRSLVAHSRVSTGSGELTVTVSIDGTLAKTEDSAAALVKRADTLMYVSKTNGRNRMTIREAG